ncbi:MAG: hypothetical protein LH613_16115 [Chamaesiphon sp.]|nr:hypothetical protein [Chamaesiphon sp.]
MPSPQMLVGAIDELPLPAREFPSSGIGALRLAPNTPYVYTKQLVGLN